MNIIENGVLIYGTEGETTRVNNRGINVENGGSGGESTKILKGANTPELEFG